MYILVMSNAKPQSRLVTEEKVWFPNSCKGSGKYNPRLCNISTDYWYTQETEKKKKQFLLCFTLHCFLLSFPLSPHLGLFISVLFILPRTLLKVDSPYRLS